jgi:uncharacterized membrane protein YqgA involved in biofilm formation
MLGTIVNAAAILVGGTIGLLLKKGIPERVSGGIMQGLGLICLYIGFSGSLKGENALIATISIVVGGAIGMLLDFDGRFTRLVGKVETRFTKGDGASSALGEGFITATLLFCVGAMAVVGSLNSGLTGNHEVLFTKSLLDGFYAPFVLPGYPRCGRTVLRVVAVFRLSGRHHAACAVCSRPFSATRAIAEMTCVGSLLILGHRASEPAQGHKNQGNGLHPRGFHPDRALSVSVRGRIASNRNGTVRPRTTAPSA